MTLSVERNAVQMIDGADGNPTATTSRTGLHFGVAKTIQDVIEAWHLVYGAYLQTGLIDSNPFEIHAMVKSVSPQTAVMIARLGSLPTGTLSATLDNSAGLALDSVYKKELDGLRCEGRKLMELGLFADRREDLTRSFASVIELMRLATYYGLQAGATDAVVGVHPRHARFYVRYLAFDVAGAETTYATVKNRPVVLLRLNWQQKTQKLPVPAGIDYIVKNPIPPEVFSHRFDFDAVTVEQSILGAFLRGRIE